jgi:pyruvate dehydrogenase E2 component (dihydrolipoamide acetyltransferase)
VDQGLIVLESDKASMEIPSTVAGEVVEVLVAEGEQLAEGSPVAVIEVASGGEQGDRESSQSEAVDKAVTADESQAADDSGDSDKTETDGEARSRAEAEATSHAGAEEKAEARDKAETVDEAEQPDASGVAASPATAPTEATGSGVYAGPAVRKLAREFGVQLQQVAGSGPRGRVVKEDLQQFVRKALGDEATAGGGAIPAVPEIDFARFGAIELSERSKLDRLTAANMQRSWLNVPHVTQFDEADITALEEFRAGLKAEGERRGIRLTPMPFILKACAVALRDNPKFNSSLTADGKQLVYKQYTHIGMAVDTPAGLMVPVIRDVDQKSVWQLAQEVLDMASRARERKLTPADMQGGCFTVSSLGSIGGTGFTPIVNAPEVGILGVSKAAIKPVWDGSAFAPRTLLPLALSYDHRVINGGDGGRFMTSLVTLLSDIRQLVM